MVLDLADREALPPPGSRLLLQARRLPPLAAALLRPPSCLPSLAGSLCATRGRAHHFATRFPAQGMETQQPVLQVADGTRLVGAFEETVGTQLILADAVAGDGSHRVHLVGHTDKRICFTKASEPAASSREEGEGVGGAAAAQAGAGRGLPHPTEGPS